MYDSGQLGSQMCHSKRLCCIRRVRGKDAKQLRLLAVRYSRWHFVLACSGSTCVTVSQRDMTCFTTLGLGLSKVIAEP